MQYCTHQTALATQVLKLGFVAAVAWSGGLYPASAQVAVMPPELAPVDVDEQLGAPVPMDAVFKDQAGRTVKLADLVDGKRPTVLTLAYHSCPVLCSMVLGATVNGLRDVAWSLGEHFNAVTISIDPRDTPDVASRKRSQMLGLYDRYSARKESDAWPFLVGDKKNIDRVASAVGFKYHYDLRQQQYAHPSVVMILKPNGEVARYLYGLQFNPNDLKLGLFEASEGRSITTLEKVILYCYLYDPIGAKYAIVATRVMQVGGALVALLLIGFLGLLWRRDMLGKYRAPFDGEPGSAAVPAGSSPGSGPEECESER